MRVQKIIAENIYLTMSASDAQGDPWTSLVYCAYDDKCRFY